jgi:hypothetical protein
VYRIRASSDIFMLNRISKDSRQECFQASTYFLLWYRISDPTKGSIYDEETKAPFEKSGFSIRGAYQVRNEARPDEQALITVLCDKHLKTLAESHPDWQLRGTREPN